MSGETLASAPPPAHVTTHPVGDRLAERVAERRSQIVLGVDPDPARLWPAAREAAGRDGDPLVRAGRAVAAHCRLLLDAAGGECVAVKFQVACFERLGAPGWAALADAIGAARDRGLLVIADAKRGDIDISARAYGQAFFGGCEGPFGPLPGLGADLLTANPLLGRDSLAALLSEARAVGGGLFVLVRTSNPGAADVQDLELASRGTVSDALASLVAELGSDRVGSHGLSDVGAVTGATAPEHLARLREAMPRAVLLLPGIGAQGASGEGLEAAFGPGPAGGLVSASRAIVYAADARGGGEPAGAARAEAARLRELVWNLYA
ncbi:MAG TPA: orotidine-5'-phosphate decarboxylase [Solirubrobacteraceae bacterium]